MKRTLEETELICLREFDGRSFPNSDGKKIVGYDLTRKEYFYLNKLKEIPELEFYSTLIAFKLLLKEQFKRIEGIKADEDFLSIFISKIEGTRITFNPNAGEEFEEFGDSYFNTFSATNTMLNLRDSIQSKINNGLMEKNRDISFLDNLPFTKTLLKNLTNNDEEAIEYVVNWLSCAINTRKKVMTSIAFLGPEGPGKGVLENYYLRPFYKNFLETVSNQDLESRFNGVFDNKMFIILNEIKADLKESEKVSETLKMLVTDENMQIERKGIDRINKHTFFNMFLYSNNALPFKISATDRRWTVIQTSFVKLDEVAEALDMTIDEFLEGCAAECKEFWINVYSFDYSLRAAKKPLKSSLKETIVDNTSSKSDILCKKIAYKDFDWIKERLEDAIESNGFDTAIDEDFYNELQRDFALNRISNTNLYAIYSRIAANMDMTDNQISFKVQPILGKSFTSNGKRFRRLGISEERERILSAISDDFNNKNKVKDNTKEIVKEAKKASFSKEEKEVDVKKFLEICDEKSKNLKKGEFREFVDDFVENDVKYFRFTYKDYIYLTEVKEPCSEEEKELYDTIDDKYNIPF